MARRRFKSFGDELVADPRVCHGKWTFRGTRIFVADVLDQLAEGMSWKEINRQWRGGVSSKAISEAILLARFTLLEENNERGQFSQRADEVVRAGRRLRKRTESVPSRSTGRGRRATGGTPVLQRKSG